MIRQYSAFRSKVIRFHKESGRHVLPWRTLISPYRVLVSEVMLQQTQVERVIPKFHTFLKRFPNVRLLAQAPLGDVLREWQGLGYNRRAKALHDAAKEVVLKYGGKIPNDRKELEALPGIGHYTAGAVRAFGFDEPDDFLETNIRTALINEFFQKSRKVSDEKLLKMLPVIRGKTSARLFYSALMDYGANLKRQGIRLNDKSKHYTKQKTFKGSDREVRGAILRTLAEGDPFKALKFDRKRIEKALAGLLKEGLIAKGKSRYRLP